MDLFILFAALAGLCADVQQPHSGSGYAEDLFGVKAAHKRELNHVFRGAVGVGARRR